MPMIKWRIEPTKLTRNTFHPSKCPSDFTDLANDIFTNVILQLSCLCKHSQDLFAELEQQSTRIATRTKQLTSRVNGLKERAATLNPTVEEVSLDDILSSKPFKSSNSKDVSLQERPNAVLEIYTKSQPIPALDKLNPYRSAEEKDCVKLYSNPDFFFESWCGQVKQEVDKIRPARKKRPQKTQAKPERAPKNTRVDIMRKRVEDELQHPAQMKAAGQPPPPATDVNKTRPPSSSSRIPSSSFPPPPSPQSPLPPPPKPAGITPTQSIKRTNSESIRNPSVRPSILPPPKPVSSIDRDSVFDDPLPPPPSLPSAESPRDSLPPPPSTPSIPPPVMRQSHQNKSANRATLYSVGDFDRNTLILPPPPMMSPPPPMSPLAAPPPPPPPSQFAPAAPPPPPAPSLLPSSESSFQRTTPAPAENQKKRESRGDLLTAIRQGIRLRTVDEETKKQDVRNEPAGGGMFDVQTIMEMRRRALEEEDDDDDDEEFNDWEE